MKTPGVAQFIVAVMLIASPVFAYRREYAVKLDGARKAGSEVCFYRGESAADAFALFFSSDKVACLPADQVFDLPAGLFHAFARHPDGYVSKHRDFFIHKAPPPGEAGYEMLEISLDRAAYADVSSIRASLKTGQTVGVWLAPTNDSAGTYFPLVDGETRIMVPAGMPFVPMIVANKAPVAIGRVTVIPTGESRAVSIPPMKGTTDVLAWIKLDGAALKPVSSKVDMPEFALVSGETKLHALFAAYAAIPSTHTLVIFKDVPPGPVRIQVGGKTWLHYDRELTAQTDGVTLEREPLLLTPASALELSWKVGLDSTPAPECASDKVPRPRITVTLSLCSNVGEKTTCRPTERHSQAFTPSGSVQFDGIPAGVYRVTIDGPFPKPEMLDVNVPLGVAVSLAVPIKPFRFFGAVTLNDEPIQGRLVFETGEAISDIAGMYTATLASDPLGNLIRVFVCADGRTLTYTPHAKIRENAAYDIDLRVLPLSVSVIDPEGVSVRGASVTFTPVKDESADIAYYTSPPLETDATGIVEFASVPTDKRLVICAKHAAHTPTCSDPLDQKEFSDRKTVLRFNRSTLRGRVAGHAGTGWLTLVDHFGRIVEETPLRADGSFSLQNPHASNEHAVYVSNRRALTVLPLPQALSAQTEIVLTLPDVPARSFTVSVSGMRSAAGFVGIWVDGRYVPLQALTVHQELRGRDVSIYRGQTLTIMDIAETAPILVAYAPEVPAKGDFVDPFTLPQYAGVERFHVITQTITLEARE